MTTINQLTNTRVKTHLKVLLLLAISYFFLGMTEGSFFWFPNTRDTLINFAFTLICVGSSWVLFKYLSAQLQSLPTGIKTVVILVTLCTYVTLINWIYIELIWRESLNNTPFFNIVLPLSVPLFLGWIFGYPWFDQFTTQKSRKEEPEYLLVQQGKKKIAHSLDNTLGFVVDQGLVFLVSNDGQRYLIERSLNELEASLKSKSYFRANRQLLISKKAIRSFQTGNNDKLDIMLDSHFSEYHKTTVSRHKAPQFRKWMEC